MVLASIRFFFSLLVFFFVGFDRCFGCWTETRAREGKIASRMVRYGIDGMNVWCISGTGCAKKTGSVTQVEDRYFFCTFSLWFFAFRELECNCCGIWRFLYQMLGWLSGEESPFVEKFWSTKRHEISWTWSWIWTTKKLTDTSLIYLTVPPTHPSKFDLFFLMRNMINSSHSELGLESWRSLFFGFWPFGEWWICWSRNQRELDQEMSLQFYLETFGMPFRIWIRWVRFEMPEIRESNADIWIECLPIWCQVYAR